MLDTHRRPKCKAAPAVRREETGRTRACEGTAARPGGGEGLGSARWPGREAGGGAGPPAAVGVTLPASYRAALNDTMLAVAEAYFNVQQARGELAGAAEATAETERLLVHLALKKRPRDAANETAQ